MLGNEHICDKNLKKCSHSIRCMYNASASLVGRQLFLQITKNENNENNENNEIIHFRFAASQQC